MGWLKKLDPTRSAKKINKATKSLIDGDVKKSLSEFHDAQPLRGSKVDIIGSSEDLNGASTESEASKVGSASWLNGEILRAEWEDYENRFKPYDQKLIDYATGKGVNEFGGVQPASKNKLSADVDKYLGRNNPLLVEQGPAGGNPDSLVSKSFDVSNGINLRNMSRIGISQDADEISNSARLSDAAKTIAQVGARNNMRMATEDRKNRILSGNASIGLRDGRSQS